MPKHQRLTVLISGSPDFADGNFSVVSGSVLSRSTRCRFSPCPNMHPHSQYGGDTYNFILPARRVSHNSRWTEKAPPASPHRGDAPRAQSAACGIVIQNHESRGSSRRPSLGPSTWVAPRGVHCGQQRQSHHQQAYAADQFDQSARPETGHPHAQKDVHLPQREQSSADSDAGIAGIG